MTNKSSALILDFASKDPTGFAAAIEKFDASAIRDTLRQLPSALAASIIARLSASKIQQLMAETDASCLDWLAKGSLEDVKVILVRLPEGRRKATIRKLPSGPRKVTLLRFLNYPKHSLGRYVSNEVILVPTSMPTEEVLNLIRSSKPGLPVVVVKKDGKYAGILDARRVLEGKPNTSIDKFIDTVSPLRAEAALIDTMEVDQWHSHSILAAVDHEGHVLGVISRENLLQSLEISPDIRKPLDSALSVFQLYIKVLSRLVDSVFQIRSRP
ncbi:MAG: CBS domain-containing protein [Pseudohongiellaceae bacterium]